MPPAGRCQAGNTTDLQDARDGSCETYSRNTLLQRCKRPTGVAEKEPRAGRFVFWAAALCGPPCSLHSCAPAQRINAINVGAKEAIARGVCPRG